MSCQVIASEPYRFGEDLQIGVDQNPSHDLCKPAEKLQQTSDLCACQQIFLHQVLSPIVLWIKYLFHVKTVIETMAMIYNDDDDKTRYDMTPNSTNNDTLNTDRHCKDRNIKTAMARH